MTNNDLLDKIQSPESFNQGFLNLSDGHRVFFEEHGPKTGLPIICLHGGPGSGFSPRHKEFFDLKKNRVVFFDQRGCGRSTSEDLLHANTTQHLIYDMERLRTHLGIKRWLVVGGSWGSTLGLAYATAHRDACLGAVLRGIFLARESDINWFFHGAGSLLPDAWQAFQNKIPKQHHSNIGAYLFDQILHEKAISVGHLVNAWQSWENSLTMRAPINSKSETINYSQTSNQFSEQSILRKYKIQSHYLRNKCFLPEEGILSQTSALTDLPVYLLHGRLDWICLPQAAWELHKALPLSQIQWLDHAGHNPFETTYLQAIQKEIARASKECS
jgi:proline iminopeptidase